MRSLQSRLLALWIMLVLSGAATAYLLFESFQQTAGAIITAQSIGAALSTTLAGLVVVKAGYGAAFLVLGAVAAIGSAICWFALPETRIDVDTYRWKQAALSTSAVAAE